MPEEQLQTTDLTGEPIEHTHLLSSEGAGWNNLNLVYELEPAGEMPEVVSPSHMLVISLGEFHGNFKANGTWQQENYATGDIAIFPAHELIPTVRIDREVPLIELFITPETLTNAAVETLGTNIKLIPQFKIRDPLIHQMGLALKTELETGGVDSRLYAESMTTALSIHLLRRYASCKPIIKDYQEGLPNYKLKKIIDYIHGHLEQNLTLAKLASLIHISPHYFASLFKQSTGLAPHQYITKCRLEKAKTLLRQPDLSIITICQEVGFQSQSHFTRVFRQHFTITPKAYRDLL